MKDRKYQIVICDNFANDGAEIGIDNITWSDYVILAGVLLPYGVQIIISEMQDKG